MHNFTWNRFPIKKLLIDSLLTPSVEITYLNIDMCKLESSQKGESRAESTDSSKAYRNSSAFKWKLEISHQKFHLAQVSKILKLKRSLSLKMWLRPLLADCRAFARCVQKVEATLCVTKVALLGSGARQLFSFWSTLLVEDPNILNGKMTVIMR